MANCTSSCTGSVTDILASILEIDRATFVRLSQVVQEFGGQPVVDLPSVTAVSCGGARVELLEAILEQRQANFNMLQQVLLAA